MKTLSIVAPSVYGKGMTSASGIKTGRFAWILLAALLVTSCKKDDNASEEVWKSANEQAFKSIADNSEYVELPSFGNNGSIYYKILKKGEGVKPIYYTSRVQIYYTAWYVAADPSKHISPGTVAGRQLFDDGSPMTFSVNSTGLMEGWRLALQYMVEGDKWEIWIPYTLCYYQPGYVSGTAIPSFLESASFPFPLHSTVACEIEVVGVAGIDEF
ncbi:MAG: FKBP-type peptidyl-prolyl cis-trans isomerase [Tannerella sp.]|jgi:peptidylprolyl isomerase/FKBP-type peptidyl-prolyl cis-trans isomerase FklB|nr:FKBP-type peptidyl-prolyl cis-trans isomerase [Tannerella sp.]